MRRVLLAKKSSLFPLLLKYGMLLKGGALPPGSIRNWGGREYVKIGPGDWRRLVEHNDYSKSVKNILERIHLEEKQGIKHPQEPLEKIPIKKVDPWIVRNAKDVGIDIDGYIHEISNYFIRHVLKAHGDEKTELDRGNFPIKDTDLEKIPEMIAKPDYVVFGGKRKGIEKIIYVKYAERGTALYFEEILTGEKNKSLRGNTLYKTRKPLDKNGILKNIEGVGKTDMSNAKITSPGGGHPT
jgi:hypothetical protein